ncbi:MAG TPA: hypothetical protein VMY34_05925 [Acidimicrobiales bacterium]|nr:hypothetical protein [Acidimicrobiales bacterium]
MTTSTRRRLRRYVTFLAVAISMSAAAPALAVPPTLLCPGRLSGTTNPVTGEPVCVS